MTSEITQQAAEIVRADDWLPPEAESLCKPDAADEGEYEKGERMASVARLALEVQRLSPERSFELPRRDVVEFLRVPWEMCAWFPGALEQSGILRCVYRGDQYNASLYVYIGASYKPNERNIHAIDSGQFDI